MIFSFMIGSNLKARKSKRRHRVSFTPEEDALLRRFVEIHGPDAWDVISKNMMGRTQRQCRERWRSYLMPSIRNDPWTKEEDELLVRLVEMFNNKWVQIAKFFHGRSDSNVKNRWYTHVRKRLEPLEQEEIQPKESVSDWNPFDLELLAGQQNFELEFFPGDFTYF